MNEPKKNGDETLPIINKPKHPKMGGIQGTKWKRPYPRRQKKTTSCHEKHIKFPNPLMSREAYQMEPPKRANHKGNIKFPNPPHVMRSISNGTT
jgi:hypothetical protein